MREIELTKGRIATVDDEDYGWLSKWVWFYGSHGYAHNGRRRDGETLMHRMILAAPKNRFVDHINGNRLDNRRENLRLVDDLQSSWNTGKRPNCSSEYKGVHWCKRDKAWYAMIRDHGKHLCLGMFKNEKDAALAYDCFARKFFGDYARLNLPDLSVDEAWVSETRSKRNKTSKFVGVSQEKGSDSWRAGLKVNGKTIRKTFGTEIDAARFADELIRKYRPDLPRNFPD